MFHTKEPILITTDEEALQHLTPIIESIGRNYSDNVAEDSMQTCWLLVFEHLRSKGATTLGVLARIATRAASRECKALRSYGLTPVRSKYSQPKRVWNTPEQGSEPVMAPEAFEPAHDFQRQLIQTMVELIAENSDPTQANIAVRLGVSQQTISLHVNHIRKKYHDKDNA